MPRSRPPDDPSRPDHAAAEPSTAPPPTSQGAADDDSREADGVLARVLEIVQVGTPVLRERARPLSIEELRTPQIADLIEVMRETMRDAPGVGLAAPQIGLPLQLAVIEDRAEYQRRAPPDQLAAQERREVPFHVVVNPRLEIVGHETVEHFEGCLSVDGFMALVRRARRVRVLALDETGRPIELRASGWYARILQHEIDHLGGTVYVDRMLPRTLMTVENHARHWRGRSIDDVKRALLGPP